MGKHTKKFTDAMEFQIAVVSMKKYQQIHNLIQNDFAELLRITEEHKNIETEFDALFRTCLRSLFSLIEADIYGLNNLDKYDGYNDRDSFEVKFKETFKQICKTWNKIESQQNYFDSKYSELKDLKIKRDQLIHPKEVEHFFKATESEFDKIKRVYNAYKEFINNLMNDFFISIDPTLLEEQKH